MDPPGLRPSLQTAPPLTADDRAEAYFEALAQGALGRLALGPYSTEPLPQRVGPWDLVREVGRGGTGVVYEARSADAEGRRAVKVALPGLGPEAAAWYAHEAATLDLFDHDAVVRGYGAHTDGRPYLVMAFVEGAPVSVHARGLSVRRRLTVFRDVCRAVAVVHRRHVVHGDLKPSNVYVTPGGRVTLLDFGSARRPGGPLAGAHPLLTPEFAAPEQVLGGPVSEATDVYALGLLLHEVLCGRRRRLPWGLAGGAGTPFSSTPTRAVAGESGVRAASRAADVAGLASALPPAALDCGIDELIGTALQTDPARRYATADAFARVVARVLQALVREPALVAHEGRRALSAPRPAVSSPDPA
jgi:serine/threonine protein kinase